MALKWVSSSSLYSARVANPPPVASRQSASDNHGQTPLRLSRAINQVAFAVTIRSRADFGSLRNGVECGSISNRRTRLVVLLAEPCSPWIINTG